MTTERRRIAVGGIDVEIVRLAIVSRLGWTRRQRKSFAEHERQSPREMVSGECHYYRGRSYRLSVVEGAGPPAVRIRNRSILELKVRPGADRIVRAAVLEKWYRAEMRETTRALIARWESRIGVRVAQRGVRKMKTRWGTCNPDAGRIWLNLELIKKPSTCMEYIVVHELIHLLERQHNDRFVEYMDRFLSRWRVLRAELNRAPLAHADWEY